MSEDFHSRILLELFPPEFLTAAVECRLGRGTRPRVVQTRRFLEGTGRSRYLVPPSLTVCVLLPATSLEHHQRLAAPAVYEVLRVEGLDEADAGVEQQRRRPKKVAEAFLIALFFASVSVRFLLGS